jgi:hypothetical protein
MPAELQALLLVAVWVLGVGYIVYWWFFKGDARSRRKLRSAPRRRIADVKNGELVKIVGTIEVRGEPLVAPLSGRACAYFAAAIHETTSEVSNRGSYRSRTKEVERERDKREFFVVQGDAKALVDVERLEVCVAYPHRVSGGDAPAELDAYLERLGEKRRRYGATRNLSAVEHALELSREVAVLGVAVWEADPTFAQGGHRGGGRRLVLRSPNARSGVIASQAPQELA